LVEYTAKNFDESIVDDFSLQQQDGLPTSKQGRQELDARPAGLIGGSISRDPSARAKEVNPRLKLVHQVP